MEKIAQHIPSQTWDGLQIVNDLPGRGRGVLATRRFVPNEVVCNYNGVLLSDKEGKARYETSPENTMGYMFSFKHKGKSMWIDATPEVEGPGRLINHSLCHANVSTSNNCCQISTNNSYIQPP